MNYINIQGYKVQVSYEVYRAYFQEYNHERYRDKVEKIKTRYLLNSKYRVFLIIKFN